MHPVTQAFKERVQEIVDRAFVAYEENGRVDPNQMIVNDVSDLFADLYARLEAVNASSHAWGRVMRAQRAFIDAGKVLSAEEAWNALVAAEEAHGRARKKWRQVVLGEIEKKGVNE